MNRNWLRLTPIDTKRKKGKTQRHNAQVLEDYHCAVRAENRRSHRRVIARGQIDYGKNQTRQRCPTMAYSNQQQGIVMKKKRRKPWDCRKQPCVLALMEILNKHDLSMGMTVGIPVTISW